MKNFLKTDKMRKAGLTTSKESKKNFTQFKKEAKKGAKSRIAIHKMARGDSVLSLPICHKKRGEGEEQISTL